ncbi:MAG: DNA replication and repair protein RecF [Bacteroidales bacterium]|nr:DNA replication and repair protein RecF [Bacteroidales bacterium]
MHCSQLNLVQFKNLEELTLELSPKFNCFAGHNGAGKTNILDAIYYLSFCKSFSNPADTQNIRFGSDFFVIQGHYKLNGQTDVIYCGMKKGQRKVFKRNKKDYERLSDHIGQYPLVLLSPADTQLILGGSDERRKFVDGVISQYNHEYLHKLITYNKALQQRNALLKIFAEQKRFDETSLTIWDEQLITTGLYIYTERKSFFDAFLPVFRDYYTFLSKNSEETDILYDSTLHEGDYQGQLIHAREKDRVLQYTTVGIHKDDLVFQIHNEPIKKYGSQGQQKSFIIALKLAQFAFTKKVKSFNPILLFDDVFDKLDGLRVKQLMQLVSQEDFGQVFVTDTNPERLETLFHEIGSECKLFVVEKGGISDTRIINGASEK